MKLANLNEEKKQFEEDLEAIIKVTDLDEYKKVRHLLKQHEDSINYLHT